MSFFLNKFSRTKIIALDLLIACISLGFAYLIRFDLKADKKLISKEWEVLSKSILLFFIIKFLVFYLFKIHKGLIRHTSTEDIRRIFLASLTCSVLFLVFGYLRYYFYDGFYLFPISVLIVEFFVSFFTLLSVRFTIKFLYLESKKDKNNIYERVLIYGTGISGIITKKTIEKDTRISYDVFGFIDDNEKIQGSRIQGLNVYKFSEISTIIKEKGIKKIILAIQHPDLINKKRMIELCLQLNVEILQVPSSKSWINGGFSAKQMAKVNIEELLGRNPIRLNTDKIKKELENQIVLVTGAAGSIGSGLVKEIATYHPKLLILLDQAESPLYDLEHELKTNFESLNFEIVIGDIRAKDRMRRLFDAYEPKYVFHTAAYKHVPLMEDNPSEAVNTNIKGTANLVNLAIEFDVSKFIMVSTDKAVNPTNVMGASKRIAEIYAQTKNESSTKFITTRFGNVLGSNGSVIPLFKKQIEQGGPITLTDERITRFFMTIPEACQLVLEAANMGEGGEIFVFDMGEPVKIIDLAKKMIQLSGLELGKDIEIKTIGLRPGEKLYEELLSKDENTLPTHHPQILKAKVKEYSIDVIDEIEYLITLFELQDNIKLVSKMKKIVPEYISNNSEFSVLDHD
jgi:FlaA1/EpsC-like NDP-sugar epimerase